MAAAVIVMKQNDLLPVIQAQLQNKDGSLPNLTGTSVKFAMSSSPGAAPIVNQTAAIIDPINGIVQYAWQVGDTAAASAQDGHYAEFIVTFIGGKVAHYPTGDYIRVVIQTAVA